MNIQTHILIPELALRLPGNSLLFNFATFLAMHFQAASLSIVPESGVPVAALVASNTFFCMGGAGNVNLGVIAGTGTAPVDIEDYKLANKIAHGVGAGQLSYGVNTTQNPSRNDNALQFAVTRSFTNTSGASIVVQELGLLVNRNGPTSNNLIFREVIEPIPILNNATRTFSIVFTISA